MISALSNQKAYYQGFNSEITPLVATWRYSWILVYLSWQVLDETLFRFVKFVDLQNSFL